MPLTPNEWRVSDLHLIFSLFVSHSLATFCPSVHSYAASVAGVKQAIIQLEHSGVPYKRPLDYYAENVKPDSHMAKIKQVPFFSQLYLFFCSRCILSLSLFVF